MLDLLSMPQQKWGPSAHPQGHPKRSDVFDDVISYKYLSDVPGIMAVVDVTQARRDLFDMVNRVQEGERFIITSKDCNAVLMSEEEYDSLLETLHLLSDPDMAADLDRTRRTPISEMEVWEFPEDSDPGPTGRGGLRGGSSARGTARRSIPSSARSRRTLQSPVREALRRVQGILLEKGQPHRPHRPWDPRGGLRGRHRRGGRLPHEDALSWDVLHSDALTEPSVTMIGPAMAGRL